MTDEAPGPGWWQAADGNWYPPSSAPSPPSWGPGPVAPPSNYQTPYVPGPRTNTNAIIALVLGVLGITSCSCLAGIPAIFMGRSAKKEIAESEGRQTGEGLAQAGFILGLVSTGLALLGILFFVFVALLGTATSHDDGPSHVPPPTPVTISVPR